MSSTRRPWYKWFPKDFATDEKVKSLSPISELVYRRLLDTMWQSSACVLLNDCLRLANVAGSGLTQEQFENAWSEIQTDGFELFKITDCGKFIYSNRMKNQIDEIEKRSKSGSLGGKASVQARLNQNSSKRQANLNDKDIDSDIDKDLLKNTCAKNCACEICFNRFWDLYDKKRDRKKCFQKWKRLKQDERDKIFETLPAYIESTKDVQYRKDPSTYLNNQSWNNEIVTRQKNGGVKKNGFNEPGYYGESTPENEYF